MNQQTDKSNPFLAGSEMTDDTITNFEDQNNIPLSAFDPFETIIDDDSSLSSSPGLHHHSFHHQNNSNNNIDNDNIPTSNEIKTISFVDTTKIVTSDIDNDHHVVNNDSISYHQQPLSGTKQFDDGCYELDEHDIDKNIDRDEEDRDDDRDDNLRKSLRIDLEHYRIDSTNDEAEICSRIPIGDQSKEQELDSVDQFHNNENSTVSYFDPFETVIDKDALNTPMNPKYFEDGMLTNESSDNSSQPPINNDNENSSMNTKNNDDDRSSDVDRQQQANVDGDIEVDCEQVAKPDIQEKSLNINDISKRDATPELAVEELKEPKEEEEKKEERQVVKIEQQLQQTTRSTASRASRTPRSQRRKPSFQEDSSDEDEEDDRIQIVIRAKNSGNIERSHGASFVPLLPPPPSKSSMKQARERGQVEDMPSPIITHSSRNKQINQQQQQCSDETTTLSKCDSKSHNEVRGVDREISKQVNGDDDDEDHEFEEREYDRDDEDDDKNHQDDGGAFVIGGISGITDVPLYDNDTSYELEEFPAKITKHGWHMMLRHPPKKKITTTRMWKRIFVTIGTNVNKDKTTSRVLQVFESEKHFADQQAPMEEIPLQPTYTISEISTQQYDQYGKIFTVKIQYIFYSERFGVRPGQLARFVHSTTGHHTGTSTTSGGHGVGPTSIGDLKRYGAPLEHATHVTQIIKLGCQNYTDIKELKQCLEDELFRMSIVRDKPLSVYKIEEIQMAVRDEIYIEVDQVGVVSKQLARVRLFFLSFTNGMPTIEVGINDRFRQGKEIVGRLDILPVETEEWIRIEDSEFHCTVDKEEYNKPDQSRMIKLTPPDGVFFELMRFRVRPPRNPELPLQVSGSLSVTRTRVTIQVDVIVPGCTSRKHGIIPCEDIAIRVYVPECWIYFFRTEKHFRYGSVKSCNKRIGKVKGLDRLFAGGLNPSVNSNNDLDNAKCNLIEVTSGQAKYEHAHGAIVWRAARWPKENQPAYIQNSMKIKLPLTIYDKMPDKFDEYIYVEYSMPASTVSHTTLRSISLNPCDDEPPEKYVKYSAMYEYKVKMRTSINLSNNSNSSNEATIAEEKSPIIIMKQQIPDNSHNNNLVKQEDSNSDSDSNSGEEQMKENNRHNQASQSKR